MGDNIYLGDRNGVRTPMQWSADRNAGFSRANPARLYSPVVMDPIYSYEAVNVEVQQADSSSLLRWTKNMIALRKLFQVFGRGTIEFLAPDNRKVLAYLRRHGDEQVLCVANLSRFAQPFQLDLSSLAGKTPVEMLGYVEFPRIGRAPYPLTLGPYGVLWFELHGETDPIPESPQMLPEIDLSFATAGNSWEALTEPGPRSVLEGRVLPEYLPRQRWFGEKSRALRTSHLTDWIPISSTLGLFVVEAGNGGHEVEQYLVPLALATGDEAERITTDRPEAVLSTVTLGQASGILFDAMVRDEFCTQLTRLITGRADRAGKRGQIHGVTGKSRAKIASPIEEQPVKRVSGAYNSVVCGDQFTLKIFRHMVGGPNPDREMTRYLTEVARFTGVPGYVGSLEYRAGEKPPITLALLQRLIPNQGDGWRWFQEELGRYNERALTLRFPDVVPPDPFAGGEELLSAELDELLGISDDAAAALGRRTAELHLALARPSDDPDFAAEPMTAEDWNRLADRIQDRAKRSFDALKLAIPRLPDEVMDQASRVLSYRSRVGSRIDRIRHLTPGPARIRIHGDYHLGQVLRAGTDFAITNFEGEPTRPLAERRARQSPLRDVAGMLRSFGYAARVALLEHTTRRSVDLQQLEPWTSLWERTVSAVFLRAYLRTAGTASFFPADSGEFRQLLEAFLVDKALYELEYELDNRPAWVGIPLAGLLELELEKS
jgi:maltose alpha-D-glucosyltransferase/alpha-amylase